MSTTTPFDSVMMKYTHLLSTNDPPSATEEAEIREEIMMATIQQDTTVPEIQNALATYRSILSPVRRLSLEVIGKFLDPGARGDDGLVVNGSVASFCLVSKAWQKAAITKHSLWRDARINRDKPLFNEVVAWLGRSGTFSKTLRIEFLDRQQPMLCKKHSQGYKPADNNPDADEYGDDIHPGSEECIVAKTQLAKLLLEGPQVDMLAVTVSSTWCVRELFRSVRARAISKGLSWPGIPSLALRIVAKGGHWAETQDPDESMFKYLPHNSLSLLSLDLIIGGALRILPQTFGFQFNIPSSTLNTLTSLKVRTDLDGPQVARLLPHCGQLEHLEIKYASRNLRAQRWTGDVASLNLPARIDLPRLHTLQVDGIPPSTVRSILHFIRTPALVNLSFQIKAMHRFVDLRARSAGDHAGHFPERFLQSLGLLPQDQELEAEMTPNLHSLTMGDGKGHVYRLFLAGTALEAITQHFSSLKCLVLYGVKCINNEDPFQTLCHHMEQHQTQLLPNLEYIEITFSDDSFPLESLFQFVESRHHWARGPVGHNQPRDSLQMVALRISENSVNLANLNTYNTSPTIDRIRNLGISVERLFEL
ncbi:hypothetical protein DFP72DRAFT_1045715 [Ephemerocybe angulata]|uniref:F-box domain-containing protein n=1 Tax=Ephemerocybe angulata TaxID=980116 RepID=A0A8H6HX57_9AGAR|nr:hypothetical protein DFP72DRAFT_1045715 [Tulosesus angulatus]